MGLGYATTEEILLDQVTGKPLNNSFKKYKLFKASDMPKIDIVMIENGENYGPFGAKSIGEALAKLPKGEWTRLGVQHKCLRAAGADTGKLDMPFALRTGNGARIALTRVVASTDFDHKVDCAIQ